MGNSIENKKVSKNKSDQQVPPLSAHNFYNASLQDKKPNPINIVFKNISYSIEVDKKVEGLQLPCSKQKESKQILRNLTGIAKAGEVVAILGASGAGKTTLLNILSCRISHKSIGSLYANRQTYNYESFGDFANYVMQADVLMQTLTVRETLTFAADLKLNISAQQKDRKLYDLIHSMKLQNCLDVQVGGQFIKGISGGQKKRTSIAFELISDPQVIMLDEPTSGLDSLTAFIIVNYLSKLAHQRGKTVIMTIHQPNADIYKKFDKILLMVEGQFIYQGSAELALCYFSQYFKLKCGQFTNPAEFQLEIMHHQNPKNLERFPQYIRIYKQVQQPRIIEQIQTIKQIQILKRKNDVSQFTIFKTLLRRDFINIIKNPVLFRARLFQSFALGIYIGGIFFKAAKVKYQNQIDWYTIMGLCFFQSIGGTFSALSPVTIVFPSERQVFLKEQNSRFYSVLSYFLSRSFIEIPYLLLMPAILNSIVYWMVGLSATFQQFCTLYFTIFLVNLCGNSLGLLIGSIIKDPKHLVQAVPLILLPFALFSGFFKNTGSLVNWFGWIQYISPMKYGYIILLSNQVKYKQSRIQELNFDVGCYESVGVLIGLAFGFRLLSLFFLWLLKSKIE